MIFTGARRLDGGTPLVVQRKLEWAYEKLVLVKVEHQSQRFAAGPCTQRGLVEGPAKVRERVLHDHALRAAANLRRDQRRDQQHNHADHEHLNEGVEPAMH